ncbi:MAG TPA: small multi-drug export protein, partial [Patescibacteria group bacterium]|nr:small multi-drug export protein [Patescibacteria group bacterium]
IPTLILINILGPVSGFLIKRSKLAERFFHWLFEHTRHKFVGKYEKYGLLALALFVAIPIPGSGSWSGSVASFIFGISKRKAFLFVALGVLIAGSIIALVTTGIIEFLNFAYHI